MNNHHTSQNTGWNFDNSYVRLPKIFFSSQEPTPVQSPELVMLNGTLAKELGLDLKALQAGVEVFAGNQLPQGADANCPSLCRASICTFRDVG